MGLKFCFLVLFKYCGTSDFGANLEPTPVGKLTTGILVKHLKTGRLGIIVE